MLVVAGVLDELADELADALADELADELAAGPTALTTLAEQMTRAPPPLAEPWHCRIVTGRAEAIVPVAVQVSPTRVPPLAVPLHCVIAALVVVAGNGSQLIVWPTIPLAPERSPSGMRSPSRMPSIDWRARRLARTTMSKASTTTTASLLSSTSSRPR